MSIHPSRAGDTRAATGRRPIGGIFKGRLDFDASIIPDNVDVRWVRESSYGQRDDENLSRQFDDRGFVPATTEDFPTLAPRAIPGMPAPSDNLIRRGGLLLVKRPKEYAIEERAELDALTDQNTKSVARVSKDPNAQMDGTNFREQGSGMTVHRPEIGRGRQPGKFAE